MKATHSSSAIYRELAKSIDEGTFHYSQYEDSYFLQYDGSYQVIADKLTDFHHADDIQSAVNLIGSLPPDESSIDYYINGWEIYMTDSFRLWFLEQVSAEGTALSFPEGMEYQGDEVTGVYQLGDYWVMKAELPGTDPFGEAKCHLYDLWPGQPHQHPADL